MSSRKRKLRVLVKLMMFIAFISIMLVMLASLFSVETKATKQGIDNNDSNEVAEVYLSLKAIQAGEIRKTRWNGRDVAVLKRSKEKLKSEEAQSSNKQLSQQRLNEDSRAIFMDYFVYFNTGDSAHCPLFFDGSHFKDSCSSTLFDTSGRNLKSPSSGNLIKIPPHYFEFDADGQPTRLVIGRWKS